MKVLVICITLQFFSSKAACTTKHIILLSEIHSDLSNEVEILQLSQSNYKQDNLEQNRSLRLRS